MIQNFCLSLIAAVALFLMSPLKAIAENEQAPEVDGSVVQVWSGGYWVSGGLSGNYRFIVTQQGFEHLSNALFIQWIAEDLARSVVAETAVSELNGNAIYVFGAPACNEFVCDTATLDVQNSYSLEKSVLNLRIKAPGSIIVDWQQ